ncbi:unnamed protein product [Coregonus sp. 'balchen']|nr:unnamed protein product [Coregonus sp. 'balchen']
MEHIRLPKVEKVRLIDRISTRRASVGTLYLTATHTIFVENETEIRTETWVLHSLVCSVEKQATTTTGSPLLIHCKNYQALQFIIPQERDCHDVHISLLRLSRPVTMRREDRPGTFSTSRLSTAAICRSSQPLSGFSARCLEDEQMLEAIVRSNPCSDFMYVVDTRPKLNAMANRAAGKGYENEDNYSNIKFQFIGIENIHVMRNSLQKMLEEFLEGLESSGWLKHIKAVLDAGIFIAKAVAEEGVSVLVHCSDGWDRTAQVCSVASVLLDPYYRTLKGLMEVSPVIEQFLECVWQLSEQFPCAFEYNERFLITIHNHIYSCQYGNFIGNNQKERTELRLQEKSHSLWTYLWENRTDYINPLYRPDHIQTQGVLRPLTAPYCFKFWRALYNRFDRGMHPRQSVIDYLMAKIAMLEKEQGKSIQVKTNTLDRSHAVWASPPSDSCLSLANTPGDYSGLGGFLTSSPCQQTGPESRLLILPRPGERRKRSDTDLSTNSDDQESGIADLSSPPSEDSAKDPDEAAYSAA